MDVVQTRESRQGADQPNLNQSIQHEWMQQGGRSGANARKTRYSDRWGQTRFLWATAAKLSIEAKVDDMTSLE